MKIKLLYFLVVTFNFLLPITYALNKYKEEAIGFIPIGEKMGAIGYDAEGLPGDGPLKAKIFSISPNNKLYIYDKYDRKIQIYTLELSFIKEISVIKYNIFSIWHMKISDRGDIILVDSFGLKKIDKEGKLLFDINKKNLSDEVIYSENYFPYDNVIFFYNDRMDILYINDEGKIINDSTINKKISEINKQDGSKFNNPNILFNKQVIDKIGIYTNENNLLFLQNRIYCTSGFHVVEKYFNYLNKIIKVENKSNIDTSDLPSKSSSFLIGYDNFNNSYWHRTMYNDVYVFNAYGQLIDMFKKYNNEQTVVSSAGDVYFWEVKPDGVYFYKITRRW